MSKKSIHNYISIYLGRWIEQLCNKLLANIHTDTYTCMTVVSSAYAELKTEQKHVICNEHYNHETTWYLRAEEWVKITYN